MKRLLPALLPLLLFASPGDECAPPPVIAPDSYAACEPWLEFSDGSVSVCTVEDTWTFEMQQQR